MIRTMSFLRHDRFPLTFAVLAALAVLFVSTAALACEAPAQLGMASVPMAEDNAPCERKAVDVSCQKACLVFCQGLIPLTVSPAPSRAYAAVRYPALDARHTQFMAEADDPPPRA